jgi:hypothetical protein
LHYKLHLCIDGKRANDQIFYLEKKIQRKKNFNFPIHMYLSKRKEKMWVLLPPSPQKKQKKENKEKVK